MRDEFFNRSITLFTSLINSIGFLNNLPCSIIFQFVIKNRGDIAQRFPPNCWVTNGSHTSCLTWNSNPGETNMGQTNWPPGYSELASAVSSVREKATRRSQNCKGILLRCIESRRRTTTITRRAKLIAKLSWHQMKNARAWNWTDSKSEDKYAVIQAFWRADGLKVARFVTHSQANQSAIRYEGQRINSEAVRRGQSPKNCLAPVHIKHLIVTNKRNCRVAQPEAIWSSSLDKAGWD